MSAYQEFTGKTVEEALRQAREAFGVGLDGLDFEILTQGSRGVLGMGAEPARIVAAPRSALGGAAPRRDAAASVPLPSPARFERPPRRDEAPHDERRRGDRDRGPRRDERPPRRDDRRDRPPRAQDRAEPEVRPAEDPGTVSAGEAAQVEAARSLARERDDLQAAEASPEALAAGRVILEELLGRMGFAARVAIETGETSRINVVGEEADRENVGALIGRRGERLSALQHLVNLMLSRQMGAWTRVLIDVEDYRGRRERQLREIANRAAERVVATGKMLQLEPMPALERRWIHIALRGNASVATQSIGEEPNRRVVILPRA